MKGKVIIICIIVVSTFIIFPKSVSANIEKPTLSIGDYWDYEMKWYYEEDTITGNGRLEVKEEKTITVNDIDYNAYMDTASFTLTSTSYSGELILDFIYYYRTSDFAVIKETMDSNQLGHSERTYNPPTSLDWPLIVGESWQCETELTEIEGGISTTEEITEYYECLLETYVTTSAGIFNCYIVKKWDSKNSIDNYTLTYYSSEIGNYVKREIYTDGVLNMVLTLLSYKYSLFSTSDSDSDEKGFTSGFEIIFVIFAFCLFLFWKRKGKNRDLTE